MGPEGEILAVRSLDEPDRSPLTEFYAGALIAGWVNSHCHLELSYLKGAIPAGEGFAAFARHMGEVRHRFTEEERLQAVKEADATMWHEGVMAVGDVANGESSFPVKAQSPIRYHTFTELFGLRCDHTDHLQPLLQHPHTSATPHSLYSVQEAPFRELCHTGKGPLSIHFLESPAEKELFRQQGRLWNWYQEVGFRCDFLHYDGPADRLIQCVPADRSVMLIHNCCLDEEDLDRITNHFSAPVWWCLCPRSNDFISHLRPPVELLRRRGGHICLGTDSLASNQSLSMLEEVRMLGEEIPLAERLLWATLGGARALGLDHELGSVEEGKRPGLLLLEGLDLQTMQLTNQTSIRRLV